MSASLDEVEVLERNRAFYTAFRRRDMATMESLWAQSAKVACIHPGWQPIRGRGEVMASLRAILGQAQVPQIRCEDVSVHLVGDAAFVVCEEVLREGRLVATNIFIREGGDWRMLHHQAGPMAPDSEPELDFDEDDEDEEDDADGSEDGDDESISLTEFRSGPLASGSRLVRISDLLPGVAEPTEPATAAAHAAAGTDLGADSEEPAGDPDEDADDLGPGPLFHSPSDEPLSDPLIADADADEPDAERGPRSHPGLETRPISEINEFGDLGHGLRRSPRSARRLVN